jgi:DNA-binding IclR family transcriptional regulator
VLEGEIPRSRVAAIARGSAPTASRLVRTLVEEGFAILDGMRPMLRIRFPAHALQYLFPALIAGMTTDVSTA